MITLKLCVTLMLGALCGAKIWEISLPKQIQECYDKVYDADTSTYVGSKLSWVCESKIISQFRQPVELDAEKISYYNHLMEIFLPSNNTDDGETVPSHKRQTRRRRCLRKEYRMLSDEERTRFHNTLKALKRDTSVRPNKYDAIALFHVRGLRLAHGGPGFFGFHRFYINMLETALQEVDPFVCLPYWDCSLDSELEDPTLSIMWTPEFMGTPNGPVLDGPCANWTTPNRAQMMRNVGYDGELMMATTIEDILSRKRYEAITDSPRVRPRYNMESHHGSVHVYVGGVMSQVDTASFDPIFFLFHAFIDHIFELFREKLKAIGRDPERYPNLVTPESLHHSSATTGFGKQLQADAYRNVISESFEYEPAPTCSSSSLQCHSKYLTCKVSIGRCVPITASKAESSPPYSTITQSRMIQAIPRRERRSEMVPPALLPDPTITQSPGVSGAKLPGRVPSDTSCLKPEKFLGQAIQNDFCCDSTCDTKEWVMIPVKIISVRPPRFKKYKSYRVHNGRIDSDSDIYSPRAYNKTNRFITQRRGNPKTYRRCKTDDFVGQVLLSSRGINYHGFYEEAAIVDHRLAVSMSLGFVAVKKPSRGARISKAIIRAHDSCGRVCKASCLDPLTGHYKECTGAIAVNAEKPLMYGTTYNKAVMSVFDYEYDSNLPQFKSKSFFLTFYCDYQIKFPYTNNSSGGVTEPPVAVNPPDDDVPPSNTECLVTPQCTLDIPCVSMERQCSLHGEKHICRGSCQEYAVCMYGRFFLRVCPEGHSFDNVHKICVPGGCQ